MITNIQYWITPGATAALERNGKTGDEYISDLWEFLCLRLQPSSPLDPCIERFLNDHDGIIFTEAFLNDDTRLLITAATVGDDPRSTEPPICSVLLGEESEKYWPDADHAALVTVSGWFLAD